MRNLQPIQYFGKDNFEVVSENVKGVLQRKGLARAISPEASQRKEVSAASDEMALDYIKDYIDPIEKPMYKDHTTAWDLWEALRQVYMQQSITGVMALQERLQEFRLRDTESIMECMSRFKILRSELRNAGEDLSEAAAIGYFLKALPVAYKIIKTNLRFSSDVKKLDDLLSPLMVEEMTIGREERQAMVNRVATVKVAVEREKTGEDTERVRACWYCGGKGHIQRNCRKKKQDEEAAAQRAVEPVQPAPRPVQRRHLVA